MDDFWAQDRLVLSGEITAITILLVMAILGARILANRIPFQTWLGSSVGLRLFALLRVLLGLCGAAVLLVTLFSGEDAQANLGLGGLALFVLWPLIALQIGLSWYPWERRAVRNPLMAWVLLACGVVVGLSIDSTTLQVVFGY